jgi:DNA-binding transcriptional LysR family regulator
MDMVDLRVFLAAVRGGSFGAAAKALAMSQPSVSARIVQLERSVGAGLFTRSRRGVQLTPAGERLVGYAQRILVLADDASAAVREGGDTTRFGIGVHGTFAPVVVPRVFDALASDRLAFHVHDAHSPEIVRLVADGEVDVGFVTLVPLPVTVQTRRLFSDPAVCIVAAGHPLATSRPKVADLATTPVAMSAWHEADTFLDLLRRNPIPDHQLRWVATSDTAITLAVDHGHLALIPRSSVAARLARGELVLVDVADLPRWSIDVHLVFRARDRDRPEVHRLAVPSLWHDLASG